MKIIPIKRALLSVSDKRGVVEFARQLVDLGIEIVSTGGTKQLLHAAGIPYQSIEAVTGLPEMLGGRVKTLHPKVHGGILGRRDEHAEEAAKHEIDWIDLVIVNFYPFEKAVEEQSLSWNEAVEYIDIGGPTMVRAAAKNFAWVGVVVDPGDYASVIAELTVQKGLSIETRQRFAEKAFALTHHYDGMIHGYFLEKRGKEEHFADGLRGFASQTTSARTGALQNTSIRTEQTTSGQIEAEQEICLQLTKHSSLRYGENPHQKAYAYQFKDQKSGILSAKQHQGKPLSYNNILDAEAASVCVREFDVPACVIVKHANPCGVASASLIDEAYAQAYQADPLSAFGGIVALNRPCTKTVAEAIAAIFIEVVLAPAYSEEALAIFATKPNLRVLEIPVEQHAAWEMKFINGGVLLQEKDLQIMTPDEWKIVTQRQPSEDDMNNMLFAWRVLKHIKSNGILIAKHNTTIGIGAGQVSRIDAVDLAICKAGEKMKDTILASDAFFPFRDSIDRIASTGIRAVIQPGGSVRDDEVITACNEHNIAMVFTGRRCFRH